MANALYVSSVIADAMSDGSELSLSITQVAYQNDVVPVLIAENKDGEQFLLAILVTQSMSGKLTELSGGEEDVGGSIETE